MKSVRISDETYNIIVRSAKKNRRTISGTIDILVEYGVKVVDTANNIGVNAAVANMGVGMGMGMAPAAIEEPKTMTLEEVNEMERERREKSGYQPSGFEDLTDDELYAMRQHIMKR